MIDGEELYNQEVDKLNKLIAHAVKIRDEQHEIHQSEVKFYRDELQQLRTNEKRRVKKIGDEAKIKSSLYKDVKLLQTKEMADFVTDFVRPGASISLSKLSDWFEELYTTTPYCPENVKRTMFYFNERSKGRTYEDIGKNAGVSSTTVANQTKRHLKMLRHPKVARHIIDFS